MQYRNGLVQNAAMTKHGILINKQALKNGDRALLLILIVERPWNRPFNNLGGNPSSSVMSSLFTCYANDLSDHFPKVRIRAFGNMAHFLGTPGMGANEWGQSLLRVAQLLFSFFHEVKR